MENLLSQFRRVRRLYFSRWHAGQTWTIRSGIRYKQSLDHGLCDREHRRIFINKRTDFVIIHEICHAVTTDNHAAMWQRRMLKAADMAARLGDAQLAADLREDVSECNDPNTIHFTASDIRAEVRECVLMTDENPVPMTRVLRIVGADIGKGLGHMREVPGIKATYEAALRKRYEIQKDKANAKLPGPTQKAQ